MKQTIWICRPARFCGIINVRFMSCGRTDAAAWYPGKTAEKRAMLKLMILFYR